MDKGDIYTLIGGFVVIVIVAIIANPGSLSGIPSLSFSQTTPAIQTMETPADQVTAVTVLPTKIPEVNLTPRPPGQPYRIFYTSNPFKYPVVHLPEHMETFGASDIPLREGENVPFAYIEEPRGGLTQPFSVPYDVWVLNISVKAERQPQYAMFRMVVCDAKGSIIKGAEIQYPGSMYKVIRTPGKDLYMIISTSSVDSFRITLETPLKSYEKVQQGR
ncbi:MAG TPA: hypothetical protein PKM50_05040 [Methanoregula sp.]|nr:hypothetical protein [Methanoregula sp.]